MPLSETNKPQSQSIEDLIAQLDSPTVISQGESPNRKCLKGKRTTTSFVRHNSNGTNSVPLLQKNIITSKKYTKNLKSLNNRGLPKKNGAGGKHTWGAPGCELTDYYIDSKDPNYDSEDGPDILVTNYREIDVDDFDREIKPLVLEFFQNGDTIEVIDQLKTCRLRSRPHLVSYLVQIALENNNTCRELMSRLLRDLTYEILTEPDYSLGFDILLKNLNEITLDNPDAAEKTGTFIARAIADKVINRRYIDRFYDNQSVEEENMPDLKDSLVFKSVESARVLVTMNNHLNQLSHIWGNKGGFLAVTELVDKIKEIIQELYDSRDVDEAIRCLKELNVPHFHHELVFEAIDFALQKANDSAMDLIVDFFEKLCKTVVVTYDQFKMGLVRVVDIIQDISLDVPNASAMLEKMMNKCDVRGFVNESILELLPNRSRKRFVSEGDGGKIKEDVY